MLNDYRNQFINRLGESLVETISTEDLEKVISSVTTILADYEITERCTDVVVQDDYNDRMRKRYCACLLIDGKSKKTIYQYDRAISRFAKCIGKRFDQIGAYDIRYYLATEKDRGISSRTLETTRSYISAFFKWLMQEEAIEKDPSASIKPIKYVDVVRLPFNEVEIDTLRNAAVNVRDRAIIELLLSSGVRVSELTNLKVSDIDFNTLTVHVRNGKGGKDRVTYINAVAAKYLMEYLNRRKEDCECLFCNANHLPLNAGGVRSILKRLEAKSGVENVHPHRFRRTFATNMSRRGMDIQDIRRLLGHSNINTTLVYVSMDDREVHQAYSKYIA